MKKTCAVCRERKRLGRNLIWVAERDRYECDNCANVKRDGRGWAWQPGETEKIVEGVKYMRPDTI